MKQTLTNVFPTPKANVARCCTTAVWTRPDHIGAHVSQGTMTQALAAWILMSVDHRPVQITHAKTLLGVLLAVVALVSEGLFRIVLVSFGLAVWGCLNYGDHESDSMELGTVPEKREVLLVTRSIGPVRQRHCSHVGLNKVSRKFQDKGLEAPCRDEDGDLAESIKRSASDRLGDLVPQVRARTFPGFFTAWRF